ncbi:hypothetical protein [Dyadobacter sp. CY312]|uniref:hypothetical protein n=1 Tax=Dyadobacter sp. CY312 TaxID=2907303 RepID=UPI001F2BF873|nr:hypothetical protein [Dyadobacter sp. CY312]MCE7043483.1 hypothetical protein [Dyadobacter sp. CY312]
MVYLLWSLINLAALCWFLYIAFSVLKLIKEHLGVPSLIIFILGSLSFSQGTLTNEKPQPSYNEQMTLGVQMIDEQLWYNTSLFYAYPKDSLTGEARGDVSQSGLVIGHGWKPTLSRLWFENGKLNYSVSGTHEWKFLGLTLYSEPKQFTGHIK